MPAIPVPEEALQIRIRDSIAEFHRVRVEKASTLGLRELLKRKNPYLFRSKGLSHVQDIVKALVDAHLSSQEETLFGTFLEGMALFACATAYGGRKSASPGIDLEFEYDDTRFLVAVKSGPNWGNSSQLRKLIDDFRRAQVTLRTNVGHAGPIVCVEGCCYGRVDGEKGTHRKVCGAAFWSLVSGDDEFYRRLLGPLQVLAVEANAQFDQSYERLLARLTENLTADFGLEDGTVDWPKLLEYSSGPNPRRRN